MHRPPRVLFPLVQCTEARQRLGEGGGAPALQVRLSASPSQAGTDRGLPAASIMTGSGREEIVRIPHALSLMPGGLDVQPALGCCLHLISHPGTKQPRPCLALGGEGGGGSPPVLPVPSLSPVCLSLLRVPLIFGVPGTSGRGDHRAWDDTRSPDAWGPSHSGKGTGAGNESSGPGHLGPLQLQGETGTLTEISSWIWVMISLTLWYETWQTRSLLLCPELGMRPH